MGWKKVKQHYKIEHIVQVDRDKNICIGSAYAHDLMVISMDGRLVKRYGENGSMGRNRDLLRYQREMDADPGKLRELVMAEDEFSKSVPVYTYKYGTAEIVETACEKPGWPNIAHDGSLMHEDQFFPTRVEAVREALDTCERMVPMLADLLKEKGEELANTERRMRLAEISADVLRAELGVAPVVELPLPDAMPCPWCGAKACVPAPVDGAYGTAMQVSCPCCRARGPKRPLPEAALEAWNEVAVALASAKEAEDSGETITGVPAGQAYVVNATGKGKKR